MVSRTDTRVSVWWDGQCVTVTLPTTTFYLTMQEATLFGEEVSNKVRIARQQSHVAIARDLLSLEETWFLADRLQALAGSYSPTTAPPQWVQRESRVRKVGKVDWAKEGF